MGILLGGLYTLIALGLSLVFGVMKLINVAHGDLVLLSGYIAFAMLSSFGIDPIISLVIGIPVLFALGYFIQYFMLNRAFKISMEAPLIIAFGISIILQNTFQIIWSPMSRGLNTSYGLMSFDLGGVHIPPPDASSPLKGLLQHDNAKINLEFLESNYLTILKSML